MSLDPKEREILQFLSKKAQDGEEGLTTNFVCGQARVENGKAREICNRLHSYGWIGPRDDMRHSEITPLGEEQLKAWWKRDVSPIWRWIAIIASLLVLVLTFLSLL